MYISNLVSALGLAGLALASPMEVAKRQGEKLRIST